MNAELDWADGGPRSLRYGDIYFSSIDGLAESRAVFLDGCGLPDAWATRRRFTVAELGFGTGLNILALLDLWRRTRPSGARLSIFSVEAHPLSRGEAERALLSWPELAPSAQALLAAWPAPRRGFHCIDLPDDVTLDLYVGEVGEALARWSGRADAWFLDGFAPARNPQMWRDEVLAAVARLSATGARVASFTVAGQVRRDLAAAGFDVHKRPGFGAKRERLEAVLSAPAPAPLATWPALRNVAIVGGGVAGAALARAFHRQGVTCILIEAVAPGAGASGNPAALVTPRFDAGFGPSAELHAQAFARAVELYRREVPEAVITEGALQLGQGPRDPERFGRLSAWAGFRTGGLQSLSGLEASERLDEPAGEPLAAALDIADALVVEPAAILRAWLPHAEVVRAAVARVEPHHRRWRCLDASGDVLVETDAVCLAAGLATGGFGPAGLFAVRGQAEFTSAPVFSGVASAWGAYAIPLRDGGLLFGASHRRYDAGCDLRPYETEANLEALTARRPALAARVRSLPVERLEARAAVRAATPDHLPLAGAWGDAGLYVMGGLGGRGFSLAPLLAEHIAAIAAGAPSPLPVDLAHRLRPDRFVGENRASD